MILYETLMHLPLSHNNTFEAPTFPLPHAQGFEFGAQYIWCTVHLVHIPRIEDTNIPRMLDFDSALKHIGEFGRHQKRIYLIVSLISLPLTAQMLSVVFIEAIPRQWCPSASYSRDILHRNRSLPAYCDKDDSVCNVADFSDFFSEFSSIGIANEWDLVCSNRYKTALIGYMFGVVIFGILSDKYGRRRPWLFAHIAGGVLGLMTGFVRTYTAYIALRFTVGAISGGGGLITYVLSTESIGPSYRGFAGIWQQAFYSFGYIFLFLQGINVINWRFMTVILLLPALTLLLVFKSIPESPRWLLSQGRIEEAENILRKIKRENGYHSSEMIFLKMETKHVKENKKGCQHGIIDLFTHKSVRIITVIMMITWCMTGLVYYGLVFNYENLFGKDSWGRLIIVFNFILMCLIEASTFIVAPFLFSRLGRRLSLFCLLLGVSFTCFLCMFPQLQNEGRWNMAIIFVAPLVSRFCISASYAVLHVYSAELFPTVVRNTGIAVLSVSARVGGMIAPFIVLMGEHHISLPMFLFACAALFAAIAGLRLQDTQGKRMPETFNDLE